MGAAEDAGEGIGDVKDRVVAKAEGNPIAVGLIAFGAGLLAASLIPASQREKEMAEGVKEQAQPLVDNLKDAAGEAGRNLKEPAQNAATAVKDAATDAADTVKARGEGRDPGGQGPGSRRRPTTPGRADRCLVDARTRRRDRRRAPTPSWSSRCGRRSAGRLGGQRRASSRSLASTSAFDGSTWCEESG